MRGSIKYSYFFLRLALAVVFLWFGVDKLLHPAYWLTAWVNPRFVSIAESLKITQERLIYGAGVFEILTGLSLVSSVFVKVFSALAILYLAVILFIGGLTVISVRDASLALGFLAVLFWPNSRSRY